MEPSQKIYVSPVLSLFMTSQKGLHRAQVRFCTAELEFRVVLMYSQVGAARFSLGLRLASCGISSGLDSMELCSGWLVHKVQLILDRNDEQQCLMD